MFHTLQSALESGQEARIVQIDFSAAFDRGNHLGILYRLCSVGIGGSLSAVISMAQAVLCVCRKVFLKHQVNCVVYTDAVSVKPITARYGGWLSE